MLMNTPICDFGWQAPAFTLKDPDGKAYSLEDNIGEKGFLIAFICNHCPYVQAIIDRLVADAKVLQKEGFKVLAIMSNDYTYVPSDSPDKMKQFASQHKFTFPYLVDEDQSVGKAYDAVCTPDFFGFNAQGQLQYRGRLDNIGMSNKTDERKTELLDAMLQVSSTGKGPLEQIPSMGCSIKWK